MFAPAEVTPAKKPTASADRSRVLHPGSMGMLMGGLVLIVGSLLPWVYTPFGSLSGTDGPGLWTLCCGFLAVAGALMPFRRIALAHAALPGAAAGAIVGWQAARIVQLSASTNSWGQLLPSIGMVLVAGGAVILVRTAVRLYRLS